MNDDGRFQTYLRDEMNPPQNDQCDELVGLTTPTKGCPKIETPVQKDIKHIINPTTHISFFIIHLYPPISSTALIPPQINQ